MNLRKSLIKLANRIESAWQPVTFNQQVQSIDAGWYVTEFVIEGALNHTPRLLVKTVNGELIERALIGAHSGRNRMLVYLPKGELQAYSESLNILFLSRVPSWEGRARVLLICWRYLLDFFSPITLIRMLAMQFKPAFELSTDVLDFYSPPEQSYYTAIHWWQRRVRLARFMAWTQRSLKIGIIIESESQREALEKLQVLADVILLKSADQQELKHADYWLPLAKTERLRDPAILMLKLAIGRARKSGLLASVVYCDHEYIAPEGAQLTPPVFKPNPSLAYLHCFNFIGPAALFATAELNDVKPADLLDEDWQYRTALTAFSKAGGLHVPELLIQSTRNSLLTTPEPTSQASLWPNIDWLREGEHNSLRASKEWQHEPSVDIVIPTRDGLEFLKPCVDGLLQRTDYQNFHVFIVDNGSEKQETLTWLEQIQQHQQVSVIHYPGEFNFSAINNAAVAAGSSDFVALVNNDIEVIEPNWLREMMVWATQPNVGIVGAKLLFGNGRVQHAGVTIGMGNAAGHIHRLEKGDAPGYQNRCIATQNMMAVTAACLVTPRALYEQLGGLNESVFKVAYNDIDYCLRVEQLGMDVIWTPQACLYHHESVSRGDDMSDQHIERYFKELGALQKQWKTKGFVDKYYNKHLRISDEGVFPHTDNKGEDKLVQLLSPK